MTACAVVGVLKYRKFSRPFRVMSIYLIITASQQWIAFLMTNLFGVNTFVFHVFLTITVFCYYLFHKLIEPSKGKIYMIDVAVALVIFLQLISIFYIQSLLEFPTFSMGLSALFITYTSLRYYDKLMSKPSEEEIQDNPNFWIVTGFLIFYTPSFMFWLVHNYLINAHVDVTTMLNLSKGMNVVFYLVLFYALSLDLRAQKLKYARS